MEIDGAHTAFLKAAQESVDHMIRDCQQRAKLMQTVELMTDTTIHVLVQRYKLQPSDHDLHLTTSLLTLRANIPSSSRQSPSHQSTALLLHLYTK